jgi:hypothetical protein
MAWSCITAPCNAPTAACAGNLCLDLVGDFLRAATALVERFQYREGDAVIRRVGELRWIQADHPRHIGDTVRVLCDFDHLFQDLVGTLERGALRQLHAGDQIELVLGRDEAARHGAEHQGGAEQQQRIDREHAAATLQDAPHRAVVLVGTGLEETIERTEYPAEGTVDAARERIFRRGVRMEQFGRERR